MSVRGYGHLFIQSDPPAEAPVMVGSLWSDIDDGLVKVCTSISPYTFQSVLSGNATTASALLTPRAINGVNFDGTAAITIPGITTATTITSTGNQTAVAINSASVLRCNNATALTIQGIAAGVDGQHLTVVSVGAGNVFLAHQDTGDSTAANRLLNVLTGGSTPLAAGIGSATYIYDATTARWRLQTHFQGTSISYAVEWHSASNPQPAIGNGTLTGIYLVEGATVFIQVNLTTGSGTTFGTGTWGFTLPTTLVSFSKGEIGIANTDVGTAFILSAISYSGSEISNLILSSGTPVSPTVPTTWNANDLLQMVYRYQ